MFYKTFLYCLLLLVSTCFAYPLTGTSQDNPLAHPDYLDWPTNGWSAAPLEAHADPVEIKALIDEAMAGDVTSLMGETRAIVIVKCGSIVAEAYRPGFDEDTKHVSWSMAKSMTQALVGRMIALGHIKSIDEAMPTPFPQNDPRSEITWRQWLNMTDGLDYDEIGTADLNENDVVQMMFGRGRYDVSAYAASLPALHAPGEHWNYTTAGYHLISRAIGLTLVEKVQNQAGKDQRRHISDLLQEILFAPLGMDTVLEFDPKGTFLGGSLVWASPRDFAKFGYLYLRDGVWEDEPLLPAGWVEFAQMPTSGTNTNVYGAGWWITPNGETPTHSQAAKSEPFDAYHAGGHEGQTIWVVPSKDLVIVRLGLMPNSEENWAALYEWNQRIARSFKDIDHEH